MKVIARALLVVGMILVIFGLMPPGIMVSEDETLYDPEFQPASENPQTVIPLLPTPTRAVPSVQPTLTPTPLVFESLERVRSPIPTSTGQSQNPVETHTIPAVPIRLVIKSINLDTPVVEATWRKVLYEGYVFDQYKAPKNAAGWHPNSALLGQVGNTVINGHNNMDGEVFRYLENVQVGDYIQVYSKDQVFTYVVTNTMKLREAGESSKTRMENASWIGESNDERLTLVTCWPYESNTHRLIVVARPVNVLNSR
jgi:LPXTG-site transpeptidase (sortase) family protein